MLRLVVALLLLAVAVLAAQAALAADLRTTSAAVVHRIPAPARPVLLCNPWSGGGKVDKFNLVDLANSLGVETAMLDHGIDLAGLARGAIAMERIASAWRAVTAPRRWWHRSPSSTICPSSVCRRERGTTLRSISVWTGVIRARACTPSAMPSNGVSITRR